MPNSPTIVSQLPVPPSFAGRANSQSPLSLSELASRRILAVAINPWLDLRDPRGGRRPMFNPATADSSVLRERVEAWWWLGRQAPSWVPPTTDAGPRLIAGVDVNTRVILACFEIDGSKWGIAIKGAAGTELLRVPVVASSDCDAGELRGRFAGPDIFFGQRPPEQRIVFDRHGARC